MLTFKETKCNTCGGRVWSVFDNTGQTVFCGCENCDE